MNNDSSNKQRWRFFFINVSAFAIIFLSLGLIILQVLQSSTYRQTDLSLESMKENQNLIDVEISRYQQDDPFISQPPARVTNELKETDGSNDHPPKESTPNGNGFNSIVVLWSKEGEILNKKVLGGRYNELQNLKLDTKNLDKTNTVTLDASIGSSQQLSFRTLTTAYETDEDSDVAYIQFLENTDQITESMRTFKTILIVCMVIFWLLSIALSYYISKMNMKPIMASWKKQQEFVENASHELRTPLTIIQNSLQKLFTKPEHTIIEESETIAQALNETRRLSGLTNDLLTLARSDSNQLMVVKEALDPHTFIYQLAQPFKEIATLDNKQFILENFANQPVYVDQKQIHQVLVILLDNALKYTNEKDKIILQSEISNDEWLVEVKNNGSSISDEDKKHIFDRFYREDRSRTKETGGYGLGLTIAQQIITQHGGKLTVRDWLPKGVIFQIRIPNKKTPSK
ncbi:MAG: sensor histidine kinase [Enterococcus sp.]